MSWEQFIVCVIGISLGVGYLMGWVYRGIKERERRRT